MRVNSWFSLAELKRLERLEKNVLHAKRMRIVISAIEDWTAPAIATAVGLARRVTQHWVARYNADGLVGLNDRRGRNSTTTLTAKATEALPERISSGPTEDDSVCMLRGTDIQRILAEEFGHQRSLSSVYWLLHRLGYRCLRPRPRHRLSDPAAIEEFNVSWRDRIKNLTVDHLGKRLRVCFQDE